MDEIKQQIRVAKRQLTVARFLSAFGWAVFLGLLLTVVGFAIPKIWHVDFLATQDHHDAWVLAWLVAGGVLGLLVACLLAWIGRESEVAVATEIDRRFALRERLSSAVSLSDTDRNTDAAQALVNDAREAASVIDVRDEFHVQPSWRLTLPLIPVILLFIVSALPNAIPAEAAGNEESKDHKQIKTAIEEARKKLSEKKRQLAAKGLEKTDLDLDSLDKQFDQLLEDKSTTRKDALVKLNDIKEQIAQRKKQLGNNEDLKKSLNRLGDVGVGEARKIADALSKGDLKKAQKAMADLADKLKSGKLDKKQQEQLAKDLESLATRLNELAEKHEQEKQRLKEDIQRAIEEGDLDRAAKLQQQLERKEQQDQSQQRLNKLAQKLQKCANCVKKGRNDSGQSNQRQSGNQPANSSDQAGDASMKQAAEALEDMADQLEQMQQELEELENLEDLERIARDAQQACRGQAEQDGPPRWNDFGIGKGPGGGKRDLEREKVGTFKSRVKSKLQSGQTVITGSADGDNISGRSVSETQALIRAEMSKDADPLENQQLPKSQREHARQYFEALREVE